MFGVDTITNTYLVKYIYREPRYQKVLSGSGSERDGPGWTEEESRHIVPWSSLVRGKIVKEQGIHQSN